MSTSLPTIYADLTPPERRAVREAYVAAQDGLCYHCKAPLDGPPAASSSTKTIRHYFYPPNFFKYPVHLHHSRKTGLTIGAVHNHCNAVLWEYHGE